MDQCRRFFKALGVRIESQDVLVWHSDERMLALQIQWSGGSIHVVNLYAPQSGTESIQVKSWWESYNQSMCKQPTHAPAIILGDCNCKVGSVASDSIGDLAADFEDEA